MFGNLEIAVGTDADADDDDGGNLYGLQEQWQTIYMYKSECSLWGWFKREAERGSATLGLLLLLQTRMRKGEKVRVEKCSLTHELMTRRIDHTWR